MHKLSTLFPLFAFFLSIGALVWATFTAIYARNCTLYVQKSNVRSKTLKELTEIQTTLTDHADSITNLHTMHKKLRSRIGMRRLADEKEAGIVDGVPDSTQDPEGWKIAMRKKLHLQKG